MSTSGTQLERKSIEDGTLELLRGLLAELGSGSAVEELDRRRSSAHLERDLGLGSLERVEVLLRLETLFGARLPDRVVAEANTVGDLVQAVLKQDSDAEDPAASAASRYRPSAGAASPSEAPSAALALAHEIAEAESLTEILRLRARAEPGRTHIFLYEESGTTRPITFGGLYERATSVARTLKQQGLEPGGTCAIMLPTCAEFFWTFFGALFAGGIPVPIYPPFRADRIEEYAARQAGILRNAEAQLLVTFRQAEPVARLLRPRVPSLRAVVNASHLAEAPPEAWLPGVPGVAGRPLEPQHRPGGEDIAFLQYTSGSTGSPKGVVLTHANLLANIRSITEGVSLASSDVAVSWLPLYHDMGLIGAWFVPLYAGFPVAILSPLAFLSRPERWLWAIHHHRGTLSPAPNFAYELCVRKIADKEIEGLDLSSWRAALNGAEPVNPRTIERFTERFARYGFHREALVPVYGLAEATLAVSTPPFGSGTRVDRIERGAFEREGRAVPAALENSNALEFVSAGKPLPRIEIRIADADGRDLDERREGRLLFRSPSATGGYYRNPDATREILCGEGWLDTGDLAYLAGGELYITGRSKDIIIKGGRNLYPHEVEEIAGRVPGVRTGCVVAFGVTDERAGTERLVIAAELREESGHERIAGEITRLVADTLGLPPDTVLPLPPHSIPKTSSGKLRRSETKRLYLERQLGKHQAPAWWQVTRLAVRNAGPWLVTALKRTSRRGFEAVYGVYALAVFGVLCPPMWLFVSVTPNRRAAAGITKAMLRLMLACAGVRIHLEGRELLKDFRASGPWIFAPNHESYLDIVALAALLPTGALFVAKSEIEKMPLIRTLARRIGHFAFNRSDPRARIEQSKIIEDALQRGKSVVIYPEGTFTPEPGIRPFLLGAFKAAVDTGRPICPVAVRGAREMLRDGTLLPKPGRVTLTIGPLLAPQRGGDWHEIVRLRDAAREIISRNANEPLL
jgi:1-acyl-sn-glycerol-3-phosphate acyltransferase